MNPCPICFDEIDENNEATITACNHSFCNDCIEGLFNSGNSGCPLCRGEIKQYEYKSEVIRIVIKQPIEEVTTVVNNTVVRFKHGGFMLLLWFIMILLLAFVFYLRSSINENRVNYGESLRESRAEYLETNDLLLKCNQRDEKKQFIYIRTTPFEDNYNYCPFPVHYISDCLHRN